MTVVTIWGGSDHELYKLGCAVEHHCECEGGKPTCPAHAMLTDQKTLDHLAFVITNVTRYIQAEFDPRSEFGL